MPFRNMTGTKPFGRLLYAVGFGALTALTPVSNTALAAPETPSVDVDISAIGASTGTDRQIAPGRAPVVLRAPGSAPKALIRLTPPSPQRPPALSSVPATPAILPPVESTALTPAPTTPARTTPAPTATPLLPVTRITPKPAPPAAQPAPPAPAREASLPARTQTSTLPSPGSAAYRLRFDAGATTFLAETRINLDLIATELMRHSDRIEIQAYAGLPGGLSSPARRLSLRRGLAVRKYLVDQGVLQSRIDVRALGGVRDSGPGERVDIIVNNR